MEKKRKLSIIVGSLAVLVAAAVLVIVVVSGRNQPSGEGQGGTIFVEGEIVAGEIKDYATCLGLNDNELIAKMGEGQLQQKNDGDHTTIDRRLYEDTLFGILGEATFLFGEDKLISGVIFRFTDAAADDVIDLISQELGDAETVDHIGETTTALWRNDGVNYVLNEKDSAISLMITRA